MNINGMLYGSKLLGHVDFPTSEILGPDASEDAIGGLIDRHGLIFVKPVFRGGVGKKGKAGLIGKARTLKEALAEKERLYFCEHRHGNAHAKANGVTFEAGVPAEHEVYFSISDDTRFRAPTMTLTHRGGMDIEDLPKSDVATAPFEALTGLKAFVVANALSDIGAPKEIISPLVQHLPKLWELVHHYGMTTLELNPIRMRPGSGGRLTPVACDFKCGFDRDDPRVARLGLPDQLFASDVSAFEQEVNQLRTHQGQSDVFVINEAGTILAPTFGGGANSLVTEVLGEAAIISSDFGGNPPYEKMKAVASICYRHLLAQTNVLFIVGGKSNNTDIHETFRAMGDALREHFAAHGPTPLAVVVGRGGPNLVRGMGALADTLECLGLPYRLFGFDSAMSEVVIYAKKGPVDARRSRGSAALARSSPPPIATAEEVAAERSGIRECRAARNRDARVHQGIQGIPYYLNVARWPTSRRARTASACSTSWAARAAPVTPVCHAFSGGNVVFGTSPGRRGQVLKTPAGRHSGIQQRPRRSRRRTRVQHRRRLSAAVGGARRRGGAYPGQSALDKIVIITEKISVHDAREVRALGQCDGVDIIGGNCLGVADSWNRVRIGGALGGDNPDEVAA